jgi:hypothetical protein
MRLADNSGTYYPSEEGWPVERWQYYACGMGIGRCDASGYHFQLGITPVWGGSEVSVWSWLRSLFGLGGQSPVPEGICFVAGTPVSTADDERAIEKLQPGDLVWSRDEQTGEVALQPIDRTFVTPNAEILELTIQADDGAVDRVRCTPSHPYRVEDRWVRASDLEIGDSIRSVSGQDRRVVGVQQLRERATVYNIEVRGFHTYFVGRSAVWVHNTCAQPRWVHDDSTFVSWMRNLERDRPNFGKSEIDDLVRLARQNKVEVHAEPSDLAGHPGTNWPEPHIHFGTQRVHVRVPQGYSLPPP